MLSDSFEEHVAVVARSAPDLVSALESAVAATAGCLRAGGKVLTMGNGGSAAQAEHLASELVGRFGIERPGWPAVALTASAPTVTAIANDFGFEQVFARQVEALARPGDLVVVVSTGGRSPNVVAAARRARDLGCVVVALTGAGGGDLAGVADVLVAVASDDVARIQEVHEICLHAWVADLERLAVALDTP